MEGNYCVRCGGRGFINADYNWDPRSSTILYIACPECKKLYSKELPMDDKEMFDAQMISNLKDQISRLKEALTWCANELDLWHELSDSDLNQNDVLKLETIKELLC